ncbi:MAG: LytR/AlgR family response regulator transcription factor [Bacteroidota bacterium]
MINAGIIDDEGHAIETLIWDLRENYGEEIQILFTATGPMEGIRMIRANKPDLLFCDIDMPGISGLELAELVSGENIMLVFTTAHEEYAVKAVETMACGYILKPVQPDDLDRIIEKARNFVALKHQELPVKGKIPVPDNDGVELVPCDEIIYCKSDGNYCMLKLTGNKNLTASKTLKYFEEILHSEQFVRVHKSYLVNIHHIRKFLKRDGGELVMSNNDIIPVSRHSKPAIIRLIQNHL